MRWEELAHVAPHGAGAIHHLARVRPSVEAFLVGRSKALGSTAHGGPPQGPASDPYAGIDPVTLSALESAAAAQLAPEWRSGLQLMQELRSSIQVLPTGCAGIDALLGGGLREGTVVEAAGETASGKTQLCLAAAATTAFRGEPVLYFDTTGSFAPERVARLAEAEAAAAGADGTWAQAGGADLSSQVLGCISLVRPASVYELLTHLDRLGAALEQQQRQQQQRQYQQQAALQQGGGGPPAASAGATQGGPAADALADGAAGAALRTGPRLLVVDSVSALLSTVVGNNQHTQGTALLSAVGRTLKQLAERHCIAVLVTNHVTSAGPMVRGGGGSGGGRAAADGAGGGGAAAVGVGGLKPALGEQWRPQPHMRMQLSLDNSQPPGSGARLATLTASPLQACGQQVAFRVLDTGLT